MGDLSTDLSRADLKNKVLVPREEDSELYKFHLECSRALFMFYCELQSAARQGKLWVELYSYDNTLIGSTRDFMVPEDDKDKIEDPCLVEFYLREDQATSFAFDVTVGLSESFISGLFPVIPGTVLVHSGALYYENSLGEKLLFQVLDVGNKVGYELNSGDRDICITFGYGYC